MRHVFIVNPAAGKGKAVRMVEKIEKSFSEAGEPHEILLTNAPGHGVELARMSLQKPGEVRIYSVGGDGTLNEVVNGIAGSEAELGIIPCGSGNDAVRSLYNITDPARLLKILPHSPSKPIDVGKINGQYFLNIASIGFDADVAMRSRSFKKLPLIPGSFAYILGIISALIGLKSYSAKVSIEGFVEKESKFLMAVFANGGYYGGGLKPAPRARMNDGLLDFCLVAPLSRIKIFKFFPAFQKGMHESMKEVSTCRGKTAVIESQEPFPVNIDGENKTETRVELDILPGFLKVIVP